MKTALNARTCYVSGSKKPVLRLRAFAFRRQAAGAMASTKRNLDLQQHLPAGIYKLWRVICYVASSAFGDPGPEVLAGVYRTRRYENIPVITLENRFVLIQIPPEQPATPGAPWWIHVTVVAAAFARLKQSLDFLENGQQMAIIEPEPRIMRLKSGPLDTATVKKGAIFQ